MQRIIVLVRKHCHGQVQWVRIALDRKCTFELSATFRGALSLNAVIVSNKALAAVAAKRLMRSLFRDTGHAFRACKSAAVDHVMGAGYV